MAEFRYLHLTMFKAYADLRVEVHRYFVGAMWWIIEPIVQLLIYYFVFSVLLGRGGDGYVQFLLVGLVIWRWITGTILEGTSSIQANRHLIQQVYLPKIVLPTITILTQLFKFALVLIVLLAFLVASGYEFSFGLVRLLGMIPLALLFITGATWTCASIAPFFPDFRLLVDQGVRLLFFLSGIFYTGTELSSNYQFYFYLNPVAVLVQSFREVLIDDAALSIGRLLTVAAVGIALTALGAVLLVRFDRQYAKVVR